MQVLNLNLLHIGFYKRNNVHISRKENCMQNCMENNLTNKVPSSAEDTSR